MTTMQPHLDEHSAYPVELPATMPPTESVSFGNRLHAARQARGLDLPTCAQTLKLPARVLRQLERDEYDGIDSKIYLVSYITTYGRFLGINQTSIQVELDRVKQFEPALVTTGGISHSRFLLDRYVTAATYVILTAVIVVPMIWLGVRGTLNRDLSHLSPLDAKPVAQQDATGGRDGKPGPVDVVESTGAQAPKSATMTAKQDQPLLASMAPFPNLDAAASVTTAPATTPAVAGVVAGSGSHSLSLKLASPSWVEVTEHDGTKLEYGLLPAGSSKIYRSDQPLDISIGNVSGAQVSIDGSVVGLNSFRRANVAHFRMQIQDGKASATSF
ncbi:MAG: helix-turn-helix domain-containing protein [Rhodanobacter sp.]|nr:MAG: helix-turn-helix domain-containing protein [Rhodanobacter sp.]